METNSLPIQDNATSGKELWDIQHRTIGHCGNFNQVETILIGCNRKVWSLDRPQKSQVFQGTSKAK